MTESYTDDQTENWLCNLYDEYRTALLGKKYFGCKLDRYKAANFWMELALAAFSTGAGGIGAWAIWKDGVGATMWAIVTAATLVLSFAKPLIRLTEKIEKYSRLHTEYAGLSTALRHLSQDVKAFHSLNPEHIASFKRIREVMGELARDDDPKPSTRLLKRFEAEIRKEVPAESLWLPPPTVPQPGKP